MDFGEISRPNAFLREPFQELADVLIAATRILLHFNIIIQIYKTEASLTLQTYRSRRMAELKHAENTWAVTWTRRAKKMTG